MAAVVLDHIEAGEVTLNTSPYTVTLSTSISNLDKAFLVFGVNPGSNTPRDGFVRGNINSAGTQIVFTRNQNTTSVVVYYYVVEFTSGSGIFVEHQRAQDMASGSSKDITLSHSFTLSKAFPMISCEKGGTTMSADDFIEADLTTATNLQLRCSTTSDAIADVQVIEFDDCAVETDTITYTTETSKNYTLSSAVDITRSILLHTGQESGSDDVNDTCFRGRFTNLTGDSAADVTFDRDNADSTGQLTFYVVEFTSGSGISVEDGTMSFASSGDDYTQNDTGVTVDPDNCIALASGNLTHCSGKGDYANKTFSTVTMNMKLTTNTITVYRTNDNLGTCDIQWYIITFPTGGGETITIDKWYQRAQEPMLPGLQPVSYF